MFFIFSRTFFYIYGELSLAHVIQNRNIKEGTNLTKTNKPQCLRTYWQVCRVSAVPVVVC